MNVRMFNKLGLRQKVNHKRHDHDKKQDSTKYPCHRKRIGGGKYSYER